MANTCATNIRRSLHISSTCRDYPEFQYFYAYGKRLEYKSFYVWDFPVQFGINLNYQEGNWLGDAEGLIWRSAFVASGQYTFYQNETVGWNVHVSFHNLFSLSATSSSQNFAFTYSTNAMEVNLNSIWSTSYGRIVIGAGLRQANASLEKTTVELRRDSERGTMDSASFCSVIISIGTSVVNKMRQAIPVLPFFSVSSLVSFLVSSLPMIFGPPAVVIVCKHHFCRF